MKRPDLDSIEARQQKLADPMGKEHKSVDWTYFHDTNALLAYARHLEEENKRLRTQPATSLDDLLSSERAGLESGEVARLRQEHRDKLKEMRGRQRS